MTFSTPWWLLLMLVVAALAAGYVLLLRRRRRDTVAFTNLELLDRVAPRLPGRLRHLPAVALILALTLLTIALAGPTAEARVPRNRATVVMVIDVSLSMRATDIEPSRIAAAQREAKKFAHDLTPGVNLGLVSFAGSATVLVSPTTERASVVRAIDNLKLAEATGTGEAIFAALASIEAFGAVVVTPRLKMRADYTFTRAIDAVTGLELLRRPHHKASVTAAWNPIDPLVLSGTILHVGSWIDGNRDFSIPRLTAPGYTLVNIAANYTVNQNLKVFARADNLFDLRYQNPTGYEKPGLGIYGGVKLTN